MTQDQIDPEAEIRAAVAGYFGGFLSDKTLDEVARVVNKDRGRHLRAPFLMAKIQVRRSRTMNKAASSLERNQMRPYNWVVRQPVGGGTRVFVYKDARLARLNGDMLARTGRIGNWGLRGFHIEYD